MQRDVHLSLGIAFIWICMESLIIPAQADVGPGVPAVIMGTLTRPFPQRARHRTLLSPAVTVCEAGAVPIFRVTDMKIRAVR